MNSRIQQVLVVVACAGIGLVILSLILIWATGKDGPEISIAGQGAGKLDYGEGGFTIPRDRVPAGFTELTGAAPIALLPNRQPGQMPEAGIPPGQLRAIAATVSRFLHRWEGFDLERIAAKSRGGRISPYRRLLQPVSTEQGLSDIVSRVDSSDPSGVCPWDYKGCISGSRFIGAGDIASAMTVSAFNGSRAYVTLYGLVSYTGDPEFNNIAGSTYYRSYGLLLAKRGKRWLVDRAAAETLESID